jgi:integrase/recombinase XerD
MYTHEMELPHSPTANQQAPPGSVRKRVRIIKKVRLAGGLWKFISLDRIGKRYVWDKRPGYYFLEWWEGRRRRRERAGLTPSEAVESQRRKQHELIGELIAGGKNSPSQPREDTATLIADAVDTFTEHVKAHSPDKPLTVRRYGQVLEHFDRLVGKKKKYVEAITRADIDDYKIRRSEESSGPTGRTVAPRTVNFEVSALRTFFYYLINERAVPMENPCARFKPLKDERERARRKPSTYTQSELNKLFAAANTFEKTVYGTLLLTGLREQELCNLTWKDVDLKRELRVTGEGKEGFSPKDYEERMIPIPPDLVRLLKKLRRKSALVFPTARGGRQTHLLRRLKRLAKRAGVAHATLHKFRHTYATHLLEKGCDIVTVQHLMGHSDLDTTRQYLNPDDTLKRKAANTLSLKG